MAMSKSNRCYSFDQAQDSPLVYGVDYTDTRCVFVINEVC